MLHLPLLQPLALVQRESNIASWSPVCADFGQPTSAGARLAGGSKGS